MDDIDTLLAQLRASLEGVERKIAACEAEIVDLRRAGAHIKGEIHGVERAAELFAEQSAAKPRHPVQKIVMDLLRERPSYRPEMIGWREAELVEATGLPLRSMHDFLLRAERTGLLANENGVYRLPPPQGNGAGAAVAGLPLAPAVHLTD